MSEESRAMSVAPSQVAGSMAIATTRQAQEVQAAMIVAKNFPRDERLALQRILRSCQRPGLAECAIYDCPRGGQKVSGPSVRLAEAVAQGWGNIDYGVIELEQKPGESVAMAYAWDLETNVRCQKVFTVQHAREVNDQKTGGKRKVLLTDPRDIYEMVANNGSRRMRACILGVIPGDILDQAEAACEKTLKSGGSKPLADRIRDMVIAFGELSVTKEMLEERLGMALSACSETQFVGLRKIYTSIKDGMGKREDYFNVGGGTAGKSEPTGKSRSEAAAEKLKGGKKEQPADEAPLPTAKELEAKVMEVRTVEDVDALKAIVMGHSKLTGTESANLLKVLNEAEQQFLNQG